MVVSVINNYYLKCGRIGCITFNSLDWRRIIQHAHESETDNKLARFSFFEHAIRRQISMNGHKSHFMHTSPTHTDSRRVMSQLCGWWTRVLCAFQFQLSMGKMPKSQPGAIVQFAAHWAERWAQRFLSQVDSWCVLHYSCLMVAIRQCVAWASEKLYLVVTSKRQLHDSVSY